MLRELEYAISLSLPPPATLRPVLGSPRRPLPVLPSRPSADLAACRFVFLDEDVDDVLPLYVDILADIEDA